MRLPAAAIFPRFAVLVCLVVASATTAGETEQGPRFDRERPRWTELQYSASKWLLSADAKVQASVRPAVLIAGGLKTTPSGHPVAPGPEVLEMVYTANGLGRASVTTLWADPLTGGTLQRTQIDGGSNQRMRTYRFTDIGAYHYTSWPATRREEALAPEQWTEKSEGMRPYSAGAEGRPVTEATVLLWLVAAADLTKAGDRLEALTFSRKRVNRVLAEVTGHRPAKVDFVERDASGERRRRGQIDALRLRIHGVPLQPDNDSDEEFELLGLRGDLELLLDPKTRAPLQLSGQVKIAGHLTVRLRRVVLRDKT